MLVHSCFVDDGNGQEQKPLLDEHGCAIDPIIVPDLVYNKEANLAYAEVNVFKFADKVRSGERDSQRCLGDNVLPMCREHLYDFGGDVQWKDASSLRPVESPSLQEGDASKDWIQ